MQTPALHGLDDDRAAIAWWLEAERLTADEISRRLADRGSALTAADVEHLTRNPLFRAKARAEVRRATVALMQEAIEAAQRDIALAMPELTREAINIGKHGTKMDAVRLDAVFGLMDRTPGLARITRTPGTRLVDTIPGEVARRAIAIAAEDDLLRDPTAIVPLDQAIARARALSTANGRE